MKRSRHWVDGTFISEEIIQGIGTDKEGMKEALDAASPAGRIARWRTVAEKYGKAHLFDKAQELLDPDGNATDYDDFKKCIEEAIAAVKAPAKKEFREMANHGRQFPGGSKERFDHLRKVMWKKVCELAPQLGRPPLPRELWDDLPENSKLYKVEETGDTTDWAIEWRSSSKGLFEATSYKNFSTRCRRLAKKYEEKKLKK